MGIDELLMVSLLPVLIVASGFFSGCETALFSLSQHQRRQLGRSKSFSAVIVTTLLGEMRAILITLLLANMTVNVLYFVISTVLLIRLREGYELGAAVVGVLSLVPLLVLILLGEVLPKLLASRLAQAWSRITAVPLWVVHRVLGPVRQVFSLVIITPLSRLIAPQAKPPSLSAQELETLLRLSEQQGVIDQDEEELLQEVLELSQLKVQDLMTPRVDLAALDLSDGPARLMELIRQTRHSHIPVFEQNLDHIIGMVHTRQVLLAQPKSVDQIKQLVRGVTYVPEIQRADQLLVQFRKTGTKVAIVVDEYGGTAGLVTLKDVVEQMVGRIAQSEEAEALPQVQAMGDGVWRVSAGLSVRQWAQAFLSGDENNGLVVVPGISTLGGLVMAKLAKVPQEGDQITTGNIQIEVQTMQGRRVQWLMIRLVEPVISLPDQGQISSKQKP